MVTLLRDPEQDWKKPAYTKFNKGISIVTSDYSYTEWDSTQRMLFDLKKDPDENENVAENPEYLEIVKAMSKLLADGMKTTTPAKAEQPDAEVQSEGAPLD